MHYSENTQETGHVLYHTRYLTGVKYTVRWKIEQTMTLHIKNREKFVYAGIIFLKNCTLGCHFVRIVILFAIPLTLYFI